MPMRIPGNTWLWLAVSILFECVGDIFTKLMSNAASWTYAIAAMLAYALMLMSWLAAVHYGKQLAVIGTVWLVAGQVAVVVIGAGIFEEKISSNTVTGVILAVASVIFLSIRS